MADIAIQTIISDGIVPSAAAAASGGDAFLNDGNTHFEIINGGGSACVATFASQVSPPHPGEAVADKVVTVGAGVTKRIGPFSQAAFNDANGKVQVTYDQVTTVTVAALKTGPN